MDINLLKKAAVQSFALMIAVITSSFALKQYDPVMIEATTQTNEVIVDTYLNIQTVVPINASASNQDREELIDENIRKQLGDNYLMISKPQGNHIAIQLEDIYINKSIELTFTGLTSDELTSDMITRVREEETFCGEPEYTESTSIKIDEEEGTSEEVVTRDYGQDLSHGITITTKADKDTKLFAVKAVIELDSVYAYNVYEGVESFYIDLRKPSEVYDKILVIDAGHGGKDGGALSRGETYLEKNINLEIVMELKKLLEKENIKVYYTRTSDKTVYLRPRVELANAVDCDYFISIHCNANDVSSPNGTEVLYYDNEFKGVKTFDLANIFSKELGKTVALKNKGVVERHYEDIYIMDKSTVPMVLIEVGYLTNNNDMYYLSKDKNRTAVAQGIFNGIQRAFEELPVTN